MTSILSGGRYTLADLHKSEITALEWSKNGMRLFSGDKNGVVVMTEIDFYMVSSLLLILIVVIVVISG